MATKLFQGKENPKEEMAEAKALKSGKISMRDYMQGEQAEGHSKQEAASKGKAIKSGKLSPQKYAAEHKMADGGYVCGGHRSPQDYGK